MSKISEIIKAHENDNITYVKKTDLETDKVYPLVSVKEKDGNFGKEIVFILAETDKEEKNLAFSSSVNRPDGNPTILSKTFDELYDGVVDGLFKWNEMGVVLEEYEYKGTKGRRARFVEMA